MAMAMGRKSISEIMIYDQNLNGGQGAHRKLIQKVKGGTKPGSKSRSY